MNDFLQSLRGGQKDKRAPKTRRGFDNPQPYNSTPHFHPQSGYNKQHPNNKRPVNNPNYNQMMNEDLGMYVPVEIIESITSLIDVMTKNQGFLIDFQERKAAAEERKANALEDIAASIKFMPTVYEEDTEADASDDPVDSCAEALLESEPARSSADQMSAAENERVAEVRPVGSGTESRASSIKEPVKVIKRTKKSEQEKTVKEGLLSREEVMGTIYTMREKGKTFDEVAKHLVKIGQPTFSGRGEWHAQTIHRLCSKRK
ncbi:MAG: hypothetical protein U9P10_07885 [Thermodesulfobacteriota bacterium]|nr:hypothetical protein [Thermodesulfobacteriota bacterium]